MKKLLFSLSIAISLLFSGCGDSYDEPTVQEPEAAAYIVFDTKHSDIPYPNNILFAGSDDTTLNIPIPDPTASDAAVKSALNSLDGFSTSSPITVSFNGEINASTLITGLKVYEVNATASDATKGIPAVSAITGALTFGVDYVTTISGNKIVILPIKPLKSNQNYMVVLTTDIKDNSGLSIAPDVATELLLQETPIIDSNGNYTSLDTDDALALEGLRQLTQAMIALLGAQESISREEIASVWSFKTQTIGSVAAALVANNPTATMGIADTNLTSKDMIGATGADVSALSGNAEVYVGTLSGVPYYLAQARSTYDTAPLTNSFKFATPTQSMPELNATLTIPVLVTLPKGVDMPDDGWPVVIFQHGITQNRTNLLAISEAFASVGYAAVAIDLPLHGIDDNNSALYMGAIERTFNLDLMNNQTHEAGPDGVIDESGIHYINLKSLLTSRDNMRQTTSDLIALKNSFGSVVAADGTKFDPNHIAFVGHSLGTMAPFGFFANVTDLESVTLAMPGGGIAELLNNSATFGPIIEAGLAAEGVIKGTSAYSAFILATQTVLDDADPINYAMQVGATQKIFAIEVVGDGGANLPDQVIPNRVATAPLAGTDPLVAYLQATTLSADSAPNKTARYLEGDHSSILDPSASPAATVNMQTQTASFIYSQGTAIPVGDATLLNTTYPN